MQDLITKVTSAVKSVYERNIAALFIAILFYTLKFGMVPVVAVFLLNSYLSDIKNEALISGAIFGYAIHLSIIILDIVTYHQSKNIVTILALPVRGGIAGFVLSGLVYVLKQRNVIWMLLIAVVAAGFPIWITSYGQFINSKIPLLLSLILLAIITTVATMQTELKAKGILFVMMTGFLIALFIKFLYRPFRRFLVT